MGHYCHALPVNGGLVVIGDNLPNVIRDINRMYENYSNTQLFLSPNNISEAMDTLRSKGFFIHEKGYGVCLKGWGTNGDQYAHDGYPKNPGIIQDTHPEPIIRAFQRYSFKEPVGVMVIDEERHERVYMANQPGELKRFRDFGFYGLVDAKGFTSPGGSTVWTLQQASSDENSTDRYPAKIMPGRRFEEVLEFCEEIRQKINESEREVTSENPDASSTGTEREQNLNTAGSPEKLTSKNAETSRRNMSEPYVNQFPTCTEPYVLLELSPSFDQECLHKESGGVPFEEVKQRLFRDGDPIYIECVSPGDDVVTGELRFNPDADEYCPIMITFLKNNYIRPPQFFDLVIDPKDDTSKGISVTEEPLTKNIALYLPLINESSSLMFQG